MANVTPSRRGRKVDLGDHTPTPRLSAAEAAAVFGGTYLDATGSLVRIDFTGLAPDLLAAAAESVTFGEPRFCTRCRQAFFSTPMLAQHMARSHALDPAEAALLGQLVRAGRV